MAGLQVPSRILILTKPLSCYRGTDFHQGFVVVPSNINQYKSALNWAQEVDYDKLTQYRTVYEPNEYLTYNEGFTVSLMSAADPSSQGGKVSFWNCLVEKDGNQFVIGIGQDNLLSAIKQSNLVNGKFTCTFSLGKNGALAYLVNEQMEEWKTSEIEGVTTKKKPKTIKWQAGHSYKTITQNNLYLGDIYDWLEISSEHKKTGRGFNKAIYHYKIADKPVKKLVAPFVSDNWGVMKILGDNQERINTISDLYDAISMQLNVDSDIGIAIPFLNVSLKGILDKPNPRELGEVTLDTDGKEAEALERLLFKLKEIRNIKLQTPTRYLDRLLESIGLSATEDKRPEYTEDERLCLLRSLDSDYTLDFGDGVIRHGLNKSGDSFQYY